MLRDSKIFQDRNGAMNSQLSLFEKYREPLTTEARARRTDDDTSHEAAERMNVSGKTGKHCRIVLEALEQHPLTTAAELGELCGLGHIETQRRLSDLFNAGLVQKEMARKCAVNGTRMRTWRIVNSKGN